MAFTLRRKTAFAALPLTLALMLSGCANDAPAVVTPAEPEVTVTEEPVVTPAEPAETEEPGTSAEEPDPYSARWPLTGVGTDAVADRPALIIKVENSSAVRGTQRGLQEADVLYEVVVEGGITRYLAVYNSDIPDEVMPVRSARETDIPIITPYGGMLAFSGAQQPFVTALQAAGNQLLQEGVAGFSRVSGIAAPHNVLVNPETLLTLANSSRTVPPVGGMPFARQTSGSTAAQNGTPVSAIDVRLSNIQRSLFTWDQERGEWVRSDGTTGGGTAPSVMANGDQIGAVNLIIIGADYSNSTMAGISGDVPTARLVNASGRAVFAADGRYIEGTWQKGGNADPFVFLDADGHPVEFAPGNTFVEVVPNMSGSWSFDS